MEDVSFDSQHNSSTQGEDTQHALKTNKKQKKNKHKDTEDVDNSSKDTIKKKKGKEGKQKKEKKKGKPRIPTSSSSSALNPPDFSGSTSVGLSTREFSHSAFNDRDEDASSSSPPAQAPSRKSVPLMASSPPMLGNHISRSDVHFASSPGLLDSAACRPRAKSMAATTSAAELAPLPSPSKQSVKGKEKNSHSSASFVGASDQPSHGQGLDGAAAVTRSRSNSECVLEGFLEEALLKKMGGTHTRRVSKWRKRWCRLYRCDAGTFLLTHDKQPASGKKATVRSRVDVLAMVRIEKRDDIRRCTFVLMPDDCERQPPFYFYAETESLRSRWMAAIARMQQQEVDDIVQPLRSRQPQGTWTEVSEMRPGMTTLDFDDLAEDKRRKRMVLVNGEERKEPIDIREEQDQCDELVRIEMGDDSANEDSEEARMMRDIERRVQELSAQHNQPPQQLTGFGPSAPALSMSSVPSFYPSHAHAHPHQQLQMVHQHQHQQQVLLRQPSYVAVGPHHQPAASTLSGSYNPFLEMPSPAVAPLPQQPQHQQQPHLQHHTSSYYMQPPVRRGSFVASDLSSSHSTLPQAQTVVLSTLSAAVSPSTSTSVSSVSPSGTPPSGMPALPSLSAAGPPTPHIPPPFMRQSSSIHMAHQAHHSILSSAPSAVAQS